MSGRLKSSSRQASQLMFHFPIQALGKKIRPLYCIFSNRMCICSCIDIYENSKLFSFHLGTNNIGFHVEIAIIN